MGPVESVFVPTAEDDSALVSTYLGWKRSYAPRAAHSYAIWVRRFQEFVHKTPEAMTVGDWTAFAQSLDGRFAPKCVEYALNIVHNYLRFWYEQGRLRQFPLYLARVKKAMPASHEAVTEADYDAIVRAMRARGDSSARDLAIIMMLHDTGMRVGELVKLQIDDIEEEDASAVIRTEKTVLRRRVFWNAGTAEVLHRLVVERVNARASSDWLFVSESPFGDDHITTRAVQRIVTEACRLAGVRGRRSPHSFRHAFIHRLAKLGTPDAIIAQLVGHSTPFTISQYTKLTRPEFSEYARRQFVELSTAAA